MTSTSTGRCATWAIDAARVASLIQERGRGIRLLLCRQVRAEHGSQLSEAVFELPARSEDLGRQPEPLQGDQYRGRHSGPRANRPVSRPLVEEGCDGVKHNGLATAETVGDVGHQQFRIAFPD